MRLAFLFITVCVFCFVVCFLSPLVGFFLWLPEEVLTLLFLLHHENGDFSILMKDIYYINHSQCQELMQSVGCNGSWSLPFMITVSHFVSDIHEVMALILVMCVWAWLELTQWSP